MSEEIGWGHTGACEPDCTCSLATAIRKPSSYVSQISALKQQLAASAERVCELEAMQLRLVQAFNERARYSDRAIEALHVAARSINQCGKMDCPSCLEAWISVKKTLKELTESSRQAHVAKPEEKRHIDPDLSSKATCPEPINVNSISQSCNWCTDTVKCPNHREQSEKQ